MQWAERSRFLRPDEPTPERRTDENPPRVGHRPDPRSSPCPPPPMTRSRASTRPTSTPTSGRRTTCSATSTASGSPRPRSRPTARSTAPSTSSATRPRPTSARSSRTAAKADDPAGSEARKVGDLYASFMDEAAAERLGLDADQGRPRPRSPRSPTRPGLIRTLAELQRRGRRRAVRAVRRHRRQAVRPLHRLPRAGRASACPTSRTIATTKFKPIREAYVAHVAQDVRAGRPARPRRRRPTQVMALETRLAKDHWDRVKSRDDTLTYNKKDRKALAELTPGFDWAAWFEAIGRQGRRRGRRPPAELLHGDGRGDRRGPARRLEGLARLERRSATTPRCLSKPFVDENFAFYGKTLTGAQELRPRWKRGVGAGRGVARRGGRQALRRQALPARGQGADAAARREPDRGLSRRTSRRSTG